MFYPFWKRRKEQYAFGPFFSEKVFPFRRNKKMPAIDYIVQGVITMDFYNALSVAYAPIYYK